MSDDGYPIIELNAAPHARVAATTKHDQSFLIDGSRTISGHVHIEGADKSISIPVGGTSAYRIEDEAGNKDRVLLRVGGLVYVGDYDNNADGLVFRTSGADRGAFDAAGKLGVGNIAPDTKLHVTGAIRSTEGLRQDWVTHDEITADVDNLDPALVHFYRLTADASTWTIFAWVAPATGERNWFTVFNVGVESILFAHDAAPNGGSPSPGNEMLMKSGADTALAAEGTMSFAYDPTTSKWRQYA